MATHAARLFRTASAAKPGRTTKASRQPASNALRLAFEAERGISKADASRLFERIAADSGLRAAGMRAELIPDSSWKRAGKTLGPQASQTVARLESMLSFAVQVWGSEAKAVQWLHRPHLELGGATPWSMLRTEAGGRAVEWLLAALEFGFPV